MYNIKILKKAEIDLINITSFIADDNPYQAKIVIDKIKNTLEYLKNFPFIWKNIESWLREIIESQYKFRIVYKISWNNIRVVSIFKYKENWN